MTKNLIPLSTADLSAFSKSLLQQLKSQPETPSHLSLMNMLARAAGFRNFQHLKAAQQAGDRLSQPLELPADYKTVEKALRQFDDAGCWVKWPAKRKLQELCLWVMWSRFDPKTIMQERDVNVVLNNAHLFDDTAILRRSLIGMGVMSRNRDGSDYQRVEKHPPAEAKRLIGLIAQRFKP